MATTHIYAPVGRCIYCGDTPAKLGEEHIIPFSLNGGMVLPEASCRKCEKIIQPYETTVARRIFGNFRMRYNVQTRNKRERPTHIEFGTILPNGTRGKAKLPVAEFPTMLFVFKFDKATMLLDLPQDVEKFRWVPIAISSNEELNELKNKHHWDGLINLIPQPVEFARLLAKIAYSWTVGEFGIDSFRVLPMTLDTILCRTTNVSYTVGGEWELPPPDPRGKHVLTLECLIRKPNPLIIIGIRLFPAFETPLYHVVVGEFDFQNPQHVRTFTEKMRDAQVIEQPLPVSKRLP